jgi:hypothetical protein
VNDYSTASRNDNNNFALGNRSRSAGVRRRTEAALSLEIILYSMVGLILIVAVLGIGDAMSLGQCVLAWIGIITGSEIARRLVKLNYLGGK